MMNTVKEINSSGLVRGNSKEISDGSKPVKLFFPSLISDINQHSTKSEADLIHV